MIKEPVTLPDHSLCTGCGACVQICPKGCISFEADRMDAVYPKINEKECVRCGACLKVCHLNRDDLLFKKSDTVYAGWSGDSGIRASSASGGIAAAVYRYALEHDIVTFGVRMTDDFSARYFEIKSEKDIAEAQNSKYLFSHTDDVYTAVRDYLKNGRKVIFIGLPCQIAGLKSFLGAGNDHLLTVDIVCHGTCPEEYLRQHIDAVKKKALPDRVSFRDPAYNTDKFVFSLREKDKKIYSSAVHGTDVYQLGYHEALIYRENCYHCKYARAQRAGDLTISDFSGLGQKEPWELPYGSISCIICSSEKGAGFLQKLSDEGRVTLINRPPEEAFLYEKQLIAPSSPHAARSAFVTGYGGTRRFEAVCQDIFADEMKKNRIKMLLKKDELRELSRKIVPKKIKTVLKRMMKKDHG